jgi:glycine dehydrogenase subunit 2
MRNTTSTALLFELSQPGRRAHCLPPLDVPEAAIDVRVPASDRATQVLPLPELAEGDVIRHFTNLSTLNMSVDTHFYPLGSCTMKYNPKRNERLASLSGMLHVHPLQPEETIQGMLELLYELQGLFAEISGLSGVSLQPAAGAHGELTALMVAAAYFHDRGQTQRRVVLTADSAHGTNPASARMAGFETLAVRSNSEGMVDLDDLRSKLSDQTAVFMLTNPNTLGLFERQIETICQTVHAAGGLIYLDGANMNAILGLARPGDFGADLMHYNPHKTFSGPHGGGGPGAGPICVRDFLSPYLPAPVVALREGRYVLDSDRPLSIGRVRSFFGNVGVLVRAYCYIRSHGPESLRRVSEMAILNANYLLARLQRMLPVPHGSRCMHEFVASASTLKKERGWNAMDLAKRLLDYGFHAPTVYFPMTVPEAVMVEPTETESKEMLDAFVAAIEAIWNEPSEHVHTAPHSTKISRPDEAKASRQPMVRWTSA